MPGKRKREALPSDSESSLGQPISAVAAAKSKKLQPTILNFKDIEEALLSPDAAVPEPEFGEGGSSDEDLPDAPDRPPNVQICTYQYRAESVILDTEQELRIDLKYNEDFALRGVFDFVVFRGAIHINGGNFAANQQQGQKPMVHRVFLPSTHPIALIRGLEDINRVRFFHCDHQFTLAASISPLFANIWTSQPSEFQGRSFAIADLLKRALVLEAIPQDWTRSIEYCAETSSTTLICGAPPGKSDFARRLVNRYLTGRGKRSPALPSVYFLDLNSDIPEYSPYGQISLTLVRELNLGPGFTHPAPIPGSTNLNETIRSHSFPPRSFPNRQDYFIACVEDLLQTFKTIQEQDPSVPLIIKTPGWTYSWSFDVLVKMICRVTHSPRVVHLVDRVSLDQDTLPKVSDLEITTEEHQVELYEASAHIPIDRSDEYISALKDVHMLSYFHCTGQAMKSETAHLTYDFAPLSLMTPWAFCYEETDFLLQAFSGFLMLGEWVEPQHLFTVLNGSIVQIVETEDEKVQDSFGRLPRTNKYGIPYFEKGPNDVVEPLNPKTSRLVCTALLRSLDPEARVAQLLVPKSHESLMHGLTPEKTVFVFGCCDTPGWAYTEDAYHEAAVRGRDVEINAAELPPWVAKAVTVENMGYMNTTRRYRKFLVDD